MFIKKKEKRKKEKQKFWKSCTMTTKTDLELTKKDKKNLWVRKEIF